MEIDAESIADRAEEIVKSRAFLIALLLFISAFAIRWMLRQHGFWIDEGRELMTAKNFLLGNGFRPAHDQYMGQHPYLFFTLIAISYLVFGINALAGMVTTNLLAALTVVVVFFMGKELFNRWVGIAAAVLMMFDPVHMFYSTRVLTDAPVTFFVALTLYFWIRTEQRDEAWSFYATFVAASLAVTTKLTGAVVLPALLIYYLYKEREQIFFKRRYWYVLGIFAAIYGIWEVRNLMTLGRLGAVDMLTGTYISGGTPRGHGNLYYLINMPAILGIPALLLSVIGAAAAYVYRERRMLIPLIFLPVTFIVLTINTGALNRYFLPFVPMAMVVAGYGADGIRKIASFQEERAGHAVFALLLVVSAFFMFQSGAAMIGSAAQGFTGLEEAGKWIRQNSGPNAKVVAGSGHQIRFFSDRWTKHAGRIENQTAFHRLLLEENIQYVEVDRWESTQPQWFIRIVQQSDAFQPVQGFGPQNQPSVVVYRVNQAALGG